MLDYYKGVGVLTNPIPEVLKGYVRFEAYGTTFERRSSDLYVSTKPYQGFRLKLKYPDIIIVENSLHKYAHGGFNVFDFNHKEMVSSLESLYTSLNIYDIDKVKIYQPEFECSMSLQDPEEFYRSLKTYRGKVFNDMSYKGTNYGSYYQTDYYKIKVYSKYLQMKGERGTLVDFEMKYPDSINYLKHNLRVEFVPMKNRFFGSSRPLIIKDLKNKEFLNSTYNNFIKKVSKIEREKVLLNGASYSDSELQAFAVMNNPTVRKMLKKQSFNKFKYYKALNDKLPTKFLSSEDLYKCLDDKKELLLY